MGRRFGSGGVIICGITFCDTSCSASFLYQPFLLKTEKSVFANNYMVYNFDS
jgi:hypothetical protein